MIIYQNPNKNLTMKKTVLLNLSSLAVFFFLLFRRFGALTSIVSVADITNVCRPLSLRSLLMMRDYDIELKWDYFFYLKKELDYQRWDFIFSFYLLIWNKLYECWEVQRIVLILFFHVPNFLTLIEFIPNQ